MSNPRPSIPPGPPAVAIPVDQSSSLWERISTWVSENKAVVYTIAGVAVVFTGAGVVYYLNTPAEPQTPRLSKKERRKRKEAERKAAESQNNVAAQPESKEKAKEQPKPAAVEAEDELPTITEESVANLTTDQRNEYADRLKRAGNKAYGDKAYNKAIDLYSQAILCKKDPIYYSNRAACYSALSEWQKVVDDTTTALSIDRVYLKAINRRAKAYEELKMYRDALVGYTLACIIDNFQNQSAANAVEKLLKVVATEEAQKRMADRKQTLPSHTFVNNYFVSFRAKPRPAGLEDSDELPAGSGKEQLRLGLQALEKKTSTGYEEARQAFDKAIELGDLGEFEGLAYNMRGTFRCLLGAHEEAMADLTKSIELDPSMTQSHIKLASMRLEQGDADKAFEDFTTALAANDKDPDIYYHRAQLHFIKGEFAEAAKDYQMSMDLDRDFIFSHIQLGVTQYKMGSMASSLATFRRTVKNFPKCPDVYNYYGELLLDMGQVNEAIEKFETAVELESKNNPGSMNVLPLVNKSLAIFQMKQDSAEAEKLCQKALEIDPECDIAVATMAQLLLQRGNIAEALTYFRRAADLARTEFEMINALSYSEATACQLKIQEEYPELVSKVRSANLV
ncbi:Mitochondrial import receptor subunit tom-70 [Scedosporium apiospermum]|uniref:Mitochondrial import receptor subunit tom-70 n=1 Tax=Pseudallescheria apiosperma TaxID=563466 RepID=A0A084FUK7_PSEDA|nr:Mitochondrial import receptor subunit tom-70 [Scedosporium apiospermum]KEZ38769.1 Mitochondrial import receptor subunit tom-70 [Scedosporium apiospermum]